MYWDCIYILNLDRIRHKYEEVLERLFYVGITPLNTTIVRWKGLDQVEKLPFGKQIYDTDDLNIKKLFLAKMNNVLQQDNYISEKRIDDFKPDEISIYLSFIRMIKDAKKKKYKKILILKDDVFFTSDFLESYTEIKELKEDIIFLGSSHNYWNKKKEEISKSVWFCPEKKISDKIVSYPEGCMNSSNPKLNHSFLGTYGFVINSTAYSEIIKHSMPMRYVFGVYLGKLCKKKKLTAAFLKKPIIYLEIYDNRTSYIGSLNLDDSRVIL